MNRIVLIAALFLARLLAAQERAVTYANQQWLQYYAQLNVSPKWRLLADAGLRRQDYLRHPAMVLARAGVQYHVDPDFSVAAGIAYFGLYRGSALARDERRTWQEFSYQQQHGRFYLQNRLRLEQRFFSERPAGAEGFNYRARYRFSCQFPINHNALLARTLFLQAGDEFFVNFGRQVIYNLFDHNRLFLGLGYKLNNSFQLVLNYVYQYAQKNAPASFEETEVFWLSIVHSASVRKKEP